MERERKSSESENIPNTSDKPDDSPDRVPEINIGSPIQRENQNSPRKKKKRKPVQKAPEKSPSEA